jgi:hypothetical protein
MTTPDSNGLVPPPPFLTNNWSSETVKTSLLTHDKLSAYVYEYIAAFNLSLLISLQFEDYS